MECNTVGLIYTLFSAPYTSFREKKSFAILSQYFAESVKPRKKRQKYNSNNSNKHLPYLLL